MRAIVSAAKRPSRSRKSPREVRSSPILLPRKPSRRRERQTRSALVSAPRTSRRRVPKNHAPSSASRRHQLKPSWSAIWPLPRHSRPSRRSRRLGQSRRSGALSVRTSPRAARVDRTGPCRSVPSFCVYSPSTARIGTPWPPPSRPRHPHRRATFSHATPAKAPTFKRLPPSLSAMLQSPGKRNRMRLWRSCRRGTMPCPRARRRPPSHRGRAHPCRHRQRLGSSYRRTSLLLRRRRSSSSSLRMPRQLTTTKRTMRDRALRGSP